MSKEVGESLLPVDFLKDLDSILSLKENEIKVIGKIFLISFHKSSEILVIVLRYFLLFSIIGYYRKQTS